MPEPDMPDIPELEEEPEPEVPVPLPAGAAGSIGVPAVPLEPGRFAVPGASYAPDLVCPVLSPALPDEEPELMPEEEPEPILSDPIELQAPSTKTLTRGMIHLVMKSSLKNSEKETPRNIASRRDVACMCVK
jgi:hypothetical protein